MRKGTYSGKLDRQTIYISSVVRVSVAQKPEGNLRLYRMAAGAGGLANCVTGGTG